MPHSAEALRLSGLPTPTVQPSDEPRVVTHVPATSAPESPHMNVKVEGSDSVVGVVTDGAKLLNQFGITAVVLAVFLVVFVAILWFVRQDYLALDASRTDSHERSVKALIDTFDRLRADDRSDRKEERAETRDHNAKMWAGMRDNTVAIRECNATMAKTADLMSIQVEELKKIIKTK